MGELLQRATNVSPGVIPKRTKSAGRILCALSPLGSLRSPRFGMTG